MGNEQVSSIAIIPARKEAERTPDKNVLSFCGEPVLTYSFRHAEDSQLFDDIVVVTDSAKVRQISRACDISVLFLRPSGTNRDSRSLVRLVEHVLMSSQRHYDHLCLLSPAAPLRTVNHIRESYELLTDGVNAIIGTSRYKRSIFSALGTSIEGWLTPVFPNLIRATRHEQPKVVVANGSLYWIITDVYREHGTLLPPRSMGYEMSTYSSSLKILPDHFWEVAEHLYHRRIAAGKADSELLDED